MELLLVPSWPTYLWFHLYMAVTYLGNRWRVLLYRRFTSSPFCKNCKPCVLLIVEVCKFLDYYIFPYVLSSFHIRILHGNMLIGTIPKEIGMLKNLRVLDLGSNHLIGTIPPQIGNLTSIVKLWVRVFDLEKAFSRLLSSCSFCSLSNQLLHYHLQESSVKWINWKVALWTW